MWNRHFTLHVLARALLCGLVPAAAAQQLLHKDFTAADGHSDGAVISGVDGWTAQTGWVAAATAGSGYAACADDYQRAKTYDNVAPDLEVGESIEQTVHREVQEEVGIQVDNLRYLGSQSWPFPNSLMLGFHADYAGGEIICNDEEIADAQWFAHDELPSVPPATAISRWLIDDFVEEVRRRNLG